VLRNVANRTSRTAANIGCVQPQISGIRASQRDSRCHAEMWHIESFLLLAPVFTFIAIPAVLISTPRASLPIRMIGLAAFCAAMLPIRMWESVLMACAAGLSGVLVLTGVNWLERTMFRPWLTPPKIEPIAGNQYSQVVELMTQVESTKGSPEVSPLLDRLSATRSMEPGAARTDSTTSARVRSIRRATGRH
jgi:hypothetical protein